MLCPTLDATTHMPKHTLRWRLVHERRYLAKDILNHVAGDSNFLLFGCEGLGELDNHILVFRWKDKRWLGIAICVFG